MNKYQVIIVVNVILAVIIGGVIFVNKSQGPDKFTQFKKRPNLAQEIQLQARQLMELPKDLQKKSRIDSHKKVKKGKSSEFKELFSKLESFKQELNELKSNCQSSFSKIVPDQNYIDVNISFYSNPDAVIKLVTEVLNASFTRSDAIYWRNFEELIETAPEYDPSWAYNTMAEIDTCRPSEGVNFLDTALEAARFHKWDVAQKNRLIKLILLTLIRQQKGYWTANDVVFFIGFLRKMRAQQLIPSHFRSSNDVIFDKLFSEKSDYLESLRSRKDVEFLRKDFKRFYFGIKDLGSDISQLVKEIIQELES